MVGWNKEAHTFYKGIRQKVNIISRLEFELTTMSESNTLATALRKTPQLILERNT